MKRSKGNSEHYNWGNVCSGWRLLQTENLGVIEESMPPHTQEKRHYHEFAQQFFYILKGNATFLIGKERVHVHEGEGCHIPAKTEHQIRNDAVENLNFLVISQPTTAKDRFETTLPIPYEK